MANTLFAVSFAVGDGGDGCAATGMNRISADARRLYDAGLSSPFGLQMRNQGYCVASYDPTGRGAVPAVTHRQVWERVFIRVRKFPTSGSPDPVVWALKGNIEGSPALCLRVSGSGSSGTLSLYNQGNATAPGLLLGSHTLTRDFWYCVEVHALFNNLPATPPNPPYENDAFVSWRINGLTIGSYDRAGANPQYGIDRYGQQAVQSQLGDSANTGKGLDIDYADWIADSSGWVGTSRRVTALRPTGAGTHTAWTGGNPDFRHQIDFPFPGSGTTQGVSTSTANASQSYAVETLASKGITTPIHSARVAVYFAIVGGGDISLILRRNGSETLYNIGTPPQASWATWRISTGGWDPSDTIEVGVKNASSLGGTTRIAACALLVEHETPPTALQNLAVRVLQTTYTGNGTQQSINLGAIDSDVASLLPSLVLVFPESGTSPGAWWWDSKVFASACNKAGASFDIIPVPGTVHITGASGSSNQNSVTYRLIAFFDPGERVAVRGAVALASSTDNRAVPLRNGTFTPEGLFITRESVLASDTTKVYYRGAGLSGDQSVSLGADISAVADAIQSLQAGKFEVGTLVNEATQDFGFMAWRTSQIPGSRLVAITSYTGNGSNPRTISVSLDGATPIFALVVPANNGKRWTRYGSVTRQFNGATTGSTNAITAFGSDALTVGSELNASGVTYSVFALAAGVDAAPARRPILLIGYWPPTDKGNMLAAFATRQQYRKLNGQLTNYDVQALSAVFTPPPLGTHVGETWAFWGGGDPTSSFRVDYKNTADSFWEQVPDLEPIAIMSFSWMAPPQLPDVLTWKLEPNARNLAQNAWFTSVPYWPGGTPPSANYTIDPPYIGGSSQDPSPFKNAGAITGNPPDRTLPAGNPRDGLENPLATSIATAVNANTGLIAGLGPPNLAGDYVSEFIAYHVAWYRDLNLQSCPFAGHTHVAQGITAATGEMAVRSQLDALIDALP